MLLIKVEGKHMPSQDVADGNAVAEAAELSKEHGTIEIPSITQVLLGTDYFSA